MSTREMICNLVNDKVSNDDLDLLYQLVLKFIPAAVPAPDELKALEETQGESELIPHNSIDWN